MNWIPVSAQDFSSELTDEESGYDTETASTASICTSTDRGSEISVIALTHEQRQEWRAKHGLPLSGNHEEFNANPIVTNAPISRSVNHVNIALTKPRWDIDKYASYNYVNPNDEPAQLRPESLPPLPPLNQNGAKENQNPRPSSNQAYSQMPKELILYNYPPEVQDSNKYASRKRRGRLVQRAQKQITTPVCYAMHHYEPTLPRIDLTRCMYDKWVLGSSASSKQMTIADLKRSCSIRDNSSEYTDATLTMDSDETKFREQKSRELRNLVEDLNNKRPWPRRPTQIVSQVHQTHHYDPSQFMALLEGFPTGRTPADESQKMGTLPQDLPKQQGPALRKESLPHVDPTITPLDCAKTLPPHKATLGSLRKDHDSASTFSEATLRRRTNTCKRKSSSGTTTEDTPEKEPVLLIEGLRLDTCVLKGKERARLIRLLNKFQDVFSKDRTPGLITLTEFRIDTGDAEPIKEKSRFLPLHKINALEKIILKMLQDGIIRPSSSPWAAPIVMVPKGDGEWRLCIDYRRLNSVTRTDAYPLPRMNDLITCYADADLYSSLDLTAGFWQIPVTPEDIPKTAFTCPLGLFEFVRMPFGAKNSGAVFQRAMDEIFKGMQWHTAPTYVDNVGIWSKKGESHVDVIEKVLQRCRDAGCTLNPKKCEFAQESVNYLGYHISKKGCTLSEERIRAINEYPVPKNITELARFLGMAGWCRNFVKNFAKIAAPLDSLRKKDAIWFWGDKQQQAFQQLKNALADAKTMGIYNPQKPLVLQTDACGAGLGAVLLQTDDKGKLRPIEYASRKLTLAESKYSSCETECLAVVWAIKKWSDYLSAQKFRIQVDNSALVYLLTKPTLTNNRVTRWVMLLQQYDFDIEHIKGTKNCIADALSRVNEEERKQAFEEVKPAELKQSEQESFFIWPSYGEPDDETDYPTAHQRQRETAISNAAAVKTEETTKEKQNQASKLPVEIPKLIQRLLEIFQHHEHRAKHPPSRGHLMACAALPKVPQSVTSSVPVSYEEWALWQAVNLDQLDQQQEHKFFERWWKYATNQELSSSGRDDGPTNYPFFRTVKSIEYDGIKVNIQELDELSYECLSQITQPSQTTHDHLKPPPRYHEHPINWTQVARIMNHLEPTLTQGRKKKKRRRRRPLPPLQMSQVGMETSDEEDHHTTTPPNPDGHDPMEAYQQWQRKNKPKAKRGRKAFETELTKPRDSENIVVTTNAGNLLVLDGDVLGNPNLSVPKPTPQDYKEDPYYGSLYEFLANGTNPNTKEERDKVHRLAQYCSLLEDGLLWSFWIDPSGRAMRNIPDRILVIPEKHRERALYLAHDSKYGGGHFGFDRTLGVLKTRVTWNNMPRDVEQYCKTCHVCQLNMPKPGYRGALQPVPIPRRKFDKIGMDLVGEIKKPSAMGNRWILVIVDYLTKWPEAIPLKNANAMTIVKALAQVTIGRWGIPKEIITDQGANLIGEIPTAFYKLCGITKRTTTPYHPISPTV